MPSELLYKPCKRRIPKMRLNFLYAVTWERLQSWKYVLYIFKKIFKLCFVKFSPMKEIASKKCKCRFSKFLSAGVQKRCRKCRFFRLRGNTASHYRFMLLMKFDVFETKSKTAFNSVVSFCRSGRKKVRQTVLRSLYGVLYMCRSHSCVTDATVCISVAGLCAKGCMELESVFTEVHISLLWPLRCMSRMKLAILREKWNIHNRRALAFTARVVVTCEKLLAYEISHRFSKHNAETFWRVLIDNAYMCKCLGGIFGDTLVKISFICADIQPNVTWSIQNTEYFLY